MTGKRFKKVICLIEQCGSGALARGLCQQHFHGAKRLIEEGATTWTELEQMGLAKDSVGKEWKRIQFSQLFEAKKKKGEQKE